jgi:Holliday junction DNA helicase RuvA
MINYLKGTLKRLYKEESKIVLNTGNIGYELLLPYFVWRSLEEEAIKEGSNLEMEVYYHASERQPKPVLVGFRLESEKTFFEKLIQVEGVGVNTAAKALVFSVSTIAKAIEDGDTGTLIKMPGIGNRAADKMVATLRGKMAPWALLKDEGYDSIPKTQVLGDAQEEVVSVLINLGHRQTDARSMVQGASKSIESNDTQELLREVFRIERAKGD